MKRVAALLVLAGCSGAAASGASSDVEVEPADTLAQSRVATTDATPQVVPPSSTVYATERIIPLDGDIAEIVFALGLGEHVVATDLSATYPPEADALPQIGYQRALSAEPIVAFEPI